MANIIRVKIDVKKLDKTRFFQGKPDRNGHAPLYADLVLLPRREPGQYGDTHMVKQDKKKGETVDLPIIGSATEKESSYSQSPTPAPQQPRPAASQQNDEEDVPF
jgi:hypothetical protein